MNTRQIADQLANGMQYSVICSEDVPYFAAARPCRNRETYQGTDMIDALKEICGLWPNGPVDADLHAPLHSDIPTLLLSGEADPVTPPADAERAASGLTRHRHLILKGEGHGQLTTGCMPIDRPRIFSTTPRPTSWMRAASDRHTPSPFSSA